VSINHEEQSYNMYAPLIEL